MTDDFFRSFFYPKTTQLFFFFSSLRPNENKVIE